MRDFVWVGQAFTAEEFAKLPFELLMRGFLGHGTSITPPMWLVGAKCVKTEPNAGKLLRRE